MAKNLFPLHSLFQALHRAVIHATKVARESAIDSMRKDYFDPVLDDKGNPTGSWTPKIVSVVLPHVDGDKITQEPYEIPLFALVTHQGIKLDTLSMGFEVDLHGLEDALATSGIENDQMLVSTPSGLFGTSKTLAKVEITFKGQDASEGLLRINDKILKSFPS